MTTDSGVDGSPEGEEPDAPARRSVQVPLPSGRLLVALIALVVVAGLVAGLVVAVLRLHHQNALAFARRSALVVATQYTQQFATYDYRDLSHDFALTEAHSVDPFLAQYRKETAQIEPDLVKLKSSSTGKVLSAGVASATTSHAVVDLFLDQTITNSASNQPRVDPQRVEMTMARVHGRWLITKVELP
jgi:Mce-associated membrane protein